ncbi:MAG TPA: ImmA/IrrE family metallo-endopeptidase [Pirellulales bacterium]|nr:ImmA/IrrE family metallo-endopeptidase [Pirellulales bacterium]
MIAQRMELAREALELAVEIREEAGADYNAPVNVFDLCGRLSPNVRVHFVDWSMEACYHRAERPLIEVSALRPLGRRVFNCAHELGHHAAGHGSTIDELQEEGQVFQAKSPNEFFADTFAGMLLMPKLAVRRAFTVRGWKIGSANEVQLYVVACHFGVGYATLAKHLAYGLREISAERAETLAKMRLPKLRQQLLGSDCAERLLVIDRHYEMPTVDCEVGTHLLLPAGAEVERAIVVPQAELPSGRLFLPTTPGLTRVTADDGWAAMVRVCRHQYAGWSQYRHLEEED